ncbi:TonB-dependent receptor [bacterium]|nr:TonB-dependent receptor [bacterium]
MKRFISLFLIISSTSAYSQNTFLAFVKDREHNEPLIGVNVLLDNTTIGGTTDQDGKVAVTGIPDGPYIIRFSYIGFADQSISITFPLEDKNYVFEIEMEEKELEGEEITVSTTRTKRLIKDIPTRVEVIGGEELDEKLSMRPSNISMLLNESTGIYVQQTSASSGNVNIRIQGLDGRYTQILKDGFPLFGGLSSGLSVMQIPPLDLSQVEIIKGSSSTLYGGDAIAGMVNLISKQPGKEREWTLLLNQTSAMGTDAGMFFSKRDDRLGFSILASANRQQAYDANDDNFSDLPQVKVLTVNPKIFYYPNEHSQLNFGVTTTFEDRRGGDIKAIEEKKDTNHVYVEKNRSYRANTQLKYEKKLTTGNVWTLKNSVNIFSRRIDFTGTPVTNEQLSSFSEVNLLINRSQFDVIIGGNLVTDHFKQHDQNDRRLQDDRYIIGGVFFQSYWNISDQWLMETGLRTDWHDEFGFFALPRLSVLYKATQHWSGRLTLGLGYKAPTVYSEKAEETGYRFPIVFNKHLKAETSRGGIFDVNYKTIIGDRLTLNLNQAAYLTRINDPLEVEVYPPVPDSTFYNYFNSSGYILTKGAETNVKLTFEHLNLFVGYTLISARQYKSSKSSELLLTPRHRVNLILMMEKEETYKIGYEAYFTSSQKLQSASRSKNYWIMGLMGQKTWGMFTVFLNLENFTDTRQSKFTPVVNPPYDAPTFNDVYAPLEGFVVNLGTKIRF